MKMIGYWITSLEDEDYPAPQEFVGTLDPEVRMTLADYLDSDTWPTIGAYFGYSWCRFFCGISNASMGCNEVGDGVWAWPNGLSHYVREHNVLLPREFVDHVIAHSGDANRSDSITEDPDIEFKAMVGTPVGSLDYWREWCATRRSAEFLGQLHLGRIAAAERADTEEDRMIAELTTERGLGDEDCAWAKCDEQVVLGTAICPRHTVANDQSHLLECRRSRHYALTSEFMTRCFGSRIA